MFLWGKGLNRTARAGASRAVHTEVSLAEDGAVEFLRAKLKESKRGRHSACASVTREASYPESVNHTNCERQPTIFSHLVTLENCEAVGIRRQLCVPMIARANRLVANNGFGFSAAARFAFYVVVLPRASLGDTLVLCPCNNIIVT